jgi:hypothetical protein
LDTYEPWQIVGLLDIAIFHQQQGNELAMPARAYVESIFKLGISPNMATSRSAAKALAHNSKEAPLSIWESLFSRRSILFFTCLAGHLRILEILLKFGADPRISISLANTVGVDNGSHRGVRDIIITFTPPSNRQIIARTSINLVDHVCASGKTATLRDFFQYQVERNDPDLDNQLIRRCLALIDRNLEVIEKSPTGLEDLPSLLSEREQTLPVGELDELPAPSPEKSEMAEQERSLDLGKGLQTDVDSETNRYAGVEQARIFFCKVLRSPLAHFVLGKNIEFLAQIFQEAYFVGGIVITYLYFCFTVS